uniref:Gag protein n=1 Tax=Caenorhabditis tropicalis TaxID=1561998 RepID=A0A1I7UGV0_9PELO
MGRKKTSLVIRNTGNLTDQMRKERQSETFEDMSTASSLESTSPSTSIRKRQATPSKRTIRIRKPQIRRYEGEIVDQYERTNNTHSMDSIPEPEDFEEFDKKCEAATYLGPQILPMKYVTSIQDRPVQAVFVSDFELCEAMHRPKRNSTQAKKVEYGTRFEVEMKFLEELVIDIEKLIATSGRMDVELLVTKTREENGTPRAYISLVRKMKCEKQAENLKNQPELYGFDTPDPPFRTDEHKREKTVITTNQTIPDTTDMIKRFKRLFGY